MDTNMPNLSFERDREKPGPFSRLLMMSLFVLSISAGG